MTLTAGSTLQNGKYVIQALLDQNDIGSVYQAMHVVLLQRVMVQSLDHALGDRAYYEHFFREVQQLSQQKDPVLQVCDCFVEAEMPYLVFAMPPGQAPTQWQEWLSPFKPVASAAVGGAVSDNFQESVLRNGHQHGQVGALGGAPPAGAEDLIPVELTQQLAALTPATSFPDELHDRIPAPVSLAALAEPTPPNGTTSANGHTSASTPTLVVGRAVSPGAGSTPHHRKLQTKTNRFIPPALIMTALVGAIAGAGMGWTLRFPSATGANGIPGATLFQKEQSFPPIDGWPGSDPVEFSESDLEDVYSQPQEYITAPRPARVRADQGLIESLPQDDAYAPLPSDAPIPDYGTMGINPDLEQVDPLKPLPSAEPSEPPAKVEANPTPVAPVEPPVVVPVVPISPPVPAPVTQ